MKQNLLDFNLDEMKAFAAALGEKPYRGKQLFQWIHRGAGSFDEMTDLPAAFREKLKEEADITPARVIRRQEDPTDGTRKFLFELADGERVEGVFMAYRYGNSLCVSSQVGCRMGCTFCASALDGFVRNLSAGEMLGQLFAAEREAGERISHIVIMGMGEPFDNYEQVSRFLNLLHDPQGRNMGWRAMTVSTSGIIPGIVAFGKDFPQVNLAISLHRTKDEDRRKIMPVDRKYPLEDLLEAAREYTEKTRRRITFEYALIAGENDGDRDAEDLTRILRGMLCHVNLIPLNEVEEIGKRGSSRVRAQEFADMLESAGVPATVRRRLGSSIDGACGQLRRRR
ncbi:MAG: 23S rRNA (adenine(2503)-C(2))-methyltransferase RlmN [Firmicutes bacterium]|nr:23S rRNA (adenine(2503)-C(2))-methyltransferase RlmN [Bacillota bacterium]